MKKLSSILILFTLVLCFTNCLEEKFTSDPNNRLLFSNDTVRFDTIFTTLGSSTRRLMIYNPHSRSINIESIRLLHANTSGFKVNVDGLKGSTFEDLDILKQDSMYVWVEVKIDPTNQNTPQRNEDILEFNYNGIRQQIILEAFGQDAYMWKGKEITSDTTLSAEKPFLIYDTLHIADGAKLHLQAGTRLYFQDRAVIKIDGQLLAEGTLNAPVVLRGSRSDNLFPNLSYDQMPSQWGGIIITDNSFENSFTHTHIRGTTFGIQIDSSSLDQTKMILNACILQNSGAAMIQATQAKIEAFNCEFSNASGPLFYGRGGAYRFTQCTFANLSKIGSTLDAAIHLSNYFTDSLATRIGIDLIQADFNNCIIWGNRSVEVNIDWIDDKNVLANHLFDHCLIKANGEDDENFIQTVWNEDPKFLEIGDDYQYNFQLDSLSAARGKGDPQYAIEFPYDLLERTRPAGDTDLGCYQGERK